jgi:hypothetical protein
LQAASRLGLGLLYQGSSHRLMTEIMLEEILLYYLYFLASSFGCRQRGGSCCQHSYILHLSVPCV